MPCQKTLQGTGNNKDGRVDTEFGPYKVIIQKHLADVVDMETFNKRSVKMFSHNENSGQNVTTENYKIILAAYGTCIKSILQLTELQSITTYNNHVTDCMYVCMCSFMK